MAAAIHENDFEICRRAPALQQPPESRDRKPRSDSKSLRGLSLPQRQRDRVAYLTRACQRIAELHERDGVPTLRAVRRVAAQFHRRLSAQRLRRLYYKWLAAGRDPGVFRWQYKLRPRFQFSRVQRQRLRQFIASPEITSLLDLHRALFAGATPALSYCAFTRRFTRAERKALRCLFLSRFALARAERRTAEVFK
jgi:hypothetical protein